MIAVAPTTWLRVKKSRPCPVCGKPDWCMLAADGSAALCPRTPSRRWVGRDGGGGYLHPLDGSALPRPVPMEKLAPQPTLSRAELELLCRQHRGRVNPERLGRFAAEMGLTVESLKRLDVGWAGDCWAFPMRGPTKEVRGIRLRLDSGRKLSVKGGHEGLFIPADLHWAGQVMLACEGPTSCAALLDLGFDAIGRPSCSGGGEMLAEYLRIGPRRDVVVVGDHDERKSRPDGSGFYPGQEGASRLASLLCAAGVCRSVRVLVPPFCKDAREWKRAGATRPAVEAVIKAMPYVRRSA